MLLRLGVLIVTLGCAIGAMAFVLLRPAADDWTEAAKACIADKNAGFWDDNGKYTFKMDFENVCSRRVSCAIDVQVNSAKGSLKDHGVIVFAPRGEMPTAKSYTIPVKSSVGMAQAERHCKFV